MEGDSKKTREMVGDGSVGGPGGRGGSGGVGPRDGADTGPAEAGGSHDVGPGLALPMSAQATLDALAVLQRAGMLREDIDAAYGSLCLAQGGLLAAIRERDPTRIAQNLLAMGAFAIGALEALPQPAVAAAITSIVMSHPPRTENAGRSSA